MKLCITGGGTGGHLMIAGALVEAAKKEGHEVIFIGSTKGQDKKYFEHDSLFDAVYFLETTGVVNQSALGKIKALLKIFKAFLQARKILQKHKIKALYSVGGFSAAAASFGALSLRLPLFIHEQNAVTGKLNAILKPFARRFISAYESNSPIQGYPVKDIFFQTARVRENVKTILFLGGSQGAKAINDLALSIAPILKELSINIVHQAGESDFERVRQGYEKLGVEVELYGFTKELEKLVQKADFAVSRAGASTLWELTSNGLPAFYVPYPYAAGDHQFYNARFIVENNLGWCEREGGNLKIKLLEILDEHLDVKSKKLIQYANADVAFLMIKDVAKESK
ncbi:MAG TPA: undecaprenyldiphospho-muramoylpentapeptide beta-N-acetylglucosaminyltransferase [Sulfurimonas sp. UBA12504]|nr:MAG: undecaprenyldiphospho-muramoylpentapeptide beta-N-acetylglucosaminyltransferase [Sulfurimonas sp. GWF2_37_8]DAB30758.1 MAG TPA: undecaprenyldiphospho-muramoylpentapeptide beta-N-acetylglucosaminyltransferase [Sulfurimonas sp. UBA12504]